MATPDVGAKVGKAIMDAPIGDLIRSLALGIADAQQSLDMAMLRSASMMTGEYEDAEGNKVKTTVKFDGEEVSLMELGFTPTFYQFTETTIEVKVSISMNASEEQSKSTFDMKAKADAKASAGFLSVGVSTTASVSSVSASYSSKFNYSAEASSVIKTRIVPVPPPPLLEERLRRSLDKKFGTRK